MTVTKDPIVSRDTEPKFPLIRTFLNASEYITDTETTVVVHSTTVRVIVRPVPGLRWWSVPSAAQIRRWVDATLTEDGGTMRRSGPRVETSGSVGSTFYSYYLEPVEQ